MSERGNTVMTGSSIAVTNASIGYWDEGISEDTQSYVAAYFICIPRTEESGTKMIDWLYESSKRAKSNDFNGSVSM